MQKKPIHDGEGEANSWAEDQKERGYYYDDSHGYEEYDPKADEDDVEQAFQPVPRSEVAPECDNEDVEQAFQPVPRGESDRECDTEDE